MVSRAALTSVALLLAVASATAQYRPSYAANGFTYPRPFIGGGGDSGDSDIGNRVGSGNTNNNAAPTRDELGFDTALVEAANNFPQEHKPFWLLNRDHIMTHVGLNPQTGRGPSQPAQPAQPSQVAAAVQPAQQAQSRPVQSAQPARSRPVQPAQPARVRPVQPVRARPVQLDEPQEPSIFDLAAGAQNNGPSPSTP